MLCRVCEQAEAHFWLSAKGYRIGRCAFCAFAQVLDVPSADQLDALYATLHLKHLKYRSSRSAELENERRLALMSLHLPRGASVLDAGCATGDFLAVAAGQFEGHGIDVSAEAIDYAKRRLPELSGRLTAQRLEEVAAGAEPFDAICLWDVIEHVPDPVAVLGNLMSRLRPGRGTGISAPDFGSLTARLMRSNWAFMIPPLHLGYFSWRSFAHLFDHRVPGRIVSFETRGKLVDLAFLLYKLNQMSRWLAPQPLLNWVAQRRLGQKRIYIPTNDIAYVVVRKPVSQRGAGA